MGFEFCEDGRCYRVHSEVGDGLAKFVVEELDPAEPAPLDPSEDAL